MTWIWNPAIGDDLRQENSKRPDVWLDGKAIVIGRLWRRPLDRKPRSDPRFVFIILRSNNST